MKKLTPMKRLSSQFRRVSQEFDGHIAEFGKSPNKYNPFTLRKGDMKTGIKSDFVRVYQDQNSSVSVAFSFTFKNGEEYIAATRRTLLPGLEFTLETSPAFTVDEFKPMLKEFVSIVEQGLTFEEFYEHFGDIFLKEIISDKEKQNWILSNFDSEFLTRDSTMTNNAIELRTVEEKIFEILESSQKEIESTDEYAKLKKLELEVTKITDSLAEKKAKILEDSGMDELKETKEALQTAIESSTLKEDKEDFLNNLPRHLCFFEA